MKVAGRESKMANGSIEYNGRTYRVNHSVGRDTEGEYHIVTYRSGRDTSVRVRGRGLAEAVEAFKQELEDRINRKTEGDK